MKKAVLLILFHFPFLLKAQYSTQIQTGAYPYYIYVGSLNYSSNNSNNLQKIKVDIFGGGWTSTGMGVTTYVIANRGTLQVNQVTLGSSNDNFFTLQAFANSSTGNTDFYVVTTGNYDAFALNSVILGGTPAVNQTVTITNSSTAPTGAAVPFTINPVLITDASGNIGIGTISPSGFKLAVKGTLHAQQVNVDLNNWSDYVFKKDYHLLPLNAVKTYIEKNHHLPEVPSEAQIVKDGLNLGEMNKLLMKKVEELTLYMIELKEQNDQLRAQNDRSRKDQQSQIDELKKQIKRVVNK